MIYIIKTKGIVRCKFVLELPGENLRNVSGGKVCEALLLADFTA